MAEKWYTVYGITHCNQLIYVGCTNNLERRVTQHRSQSFYGIWTGAVVLWKSQDRAAALAKEAELIETLKPYYNGRQKLPRRKTFRELLALAREAKRKQQYLERWTFDFIDDYYKELS